MREVNAIIFPHGDHFTELTPSGILAIVRISPLDPIGMMHSVVSPCFSLRPLVKASHDPSGDHDGLTSRFSSAVSGRGALDPSAVASQTRERYLFAYWATRSTTKAMCLPSGETAGDVAPICREMIRSASSACLPDAAGFSVVLTLVGGQRGVAGLHDVVDDS